jgi:hypothetical protein
MHSKASRASRARSAATRSPAAEQSRDRVTRSKLTPRRQNKQGVLEGYVDRIRAMYDNGNGRRISSIARTFDVSTTAIRKVLGLAGRSSYRITGHHAPTCIWCGKSIVSCAPSTRGVKIDPSYCRDCVKSVWATKYDREAGVGTIPEALRRRYSLSG